MGDVLLDLREAEVRTNVIDVTAVSVMGDVKIIVPDGVDVDLDGMAIMGDKKVDVMEAAPGMNVPVVRVHAYAVHGDVKVIGDSRAKPIKRGWSAMARAPRAGRRAPVGRAPGSSAATDRARLTEARLTEPDRARPSAPMGPCVRPGGRDGRRGP
ncbi:LiaF domain-containing protein [Nonomuraea dietziae]|uniref:LiaF domain-containing protein n=1 Tax=Nonomuraea dietziae TaxID=65515 RepID=UPI0031D619CD